MPGILYMQRWDLFIYVLVGYVMFLQVLKAKRFRANTCRSYFYYSIALIQTVLLINDNSLIYTSHFVKIESAQWTQKTLGQRDGGPRYLFTFA